MQNTHHGTPFHITPLLLTPNKRHGVREQGRHDRQQTMARVQPSQFGYIGRPAIETKLMQ